MVPFSMVALADFNVKSSNWFNKDITGKEDRKTEAVNSQNGLHQEINETIHILNSFSSCIDLIFNSQSNSLSCIDLIFNSQSNVLIESGIESYLQPRAY